jgi:hypothetical protein
MDTKYVKGEKWSPVKRSVDQDANPFEVLNGLVDMERPDADVVS